MKQPDIIQPILNLWSKRAGDHKYKNIKIISYIIISLILPGSCSKSIYSISTEVNKEIPKVLREEIKVNYLEVIESIKDNDYKRFKSHLSKNLIDKSGSALQSTFSKLHKTMIGKKYEIINEYYSAIKSIGSNPEVTIIPGLNDDNKLIINSLTFYSSESYNVFLKSTNKGMQDMCFISYSNNDIKWEVNIIYIGDYAINNDNVTGLYEKADMIQGKKDLPCSAFFALAGRKVLRPAPFLQYPKEREYIAKFNEIITKTNKEYKFPIEINKRIKVIAIDIAIVEEGIMPVFIYITQNKNKTKKEASRILPDVLKKFSCLKNDFSHIVLRAYYEMPNDPNKKYEYYNSVFKI